MSDHIRHFLSCRGPNPKVTRTRDKCEPGVVLYRLSVDYLFQLNPPFEVQLAQRWPEAFRGGCIHKSADGAKTIVEVVFCFPVARQLFLFGDRELK